MPSQRAIEQVYSRNSQEAVLRGTKAYAKLRRQVSQAGMLDRSYTYYTILAIATIALFLFSAYQLIITPASWLLVLWSIIGGFFAVQIAGLIHDAGHRAIAKSTKVNDALGYFYSALIAMGFQKWQVKHNKHHASTNVIDEDPDIELPVLCYTKERYLAKKGIAKVLRKYHIWFFYPIGALAGFSARLGSIEHFRSNTTWKNSWQLAIYVVGSFVWYVLPFFVFDSGKALIIFGFINMTMGLYMQTIFAPNHKGMPQIKKGTKLSFMELQICTSRNIRQSWLTDYLYVGLNNQIEHHLFTNCPRNKLRLLIPYVKQMCQELDLEYTSVNYLESMAIILQEMREIRDECEATLRETKTQEAALAARSKQIAVWTFGKGKSYSLVIARMAKAFITG